MSAKKTKEATILAALKRGHRLHRFFAQKLGDHVLPSTICALRRKGHLIVDRWIWVRTRFGKVHVKEFAFAGAGGRDE